MKKKSKTKSTGRFIIAPTKRAKRKLSHSASVKATERTVKEMEMEEQRLHWARTLNKAEDRWAGTPFDNLFEEAAAVMRCFEYQQQHQDSGMVKAIRTIYQTVGEKFIHAILKGDCQWFVDVAKHLPTWRAHQPNKDGVKVAWLAAGTPGKAQTVQQLNAAITQHGFQKKDSSYLRREARKAGLTIAGGKPGRPKG